MKKTFTDEDIKALTWAIDTIGYMKGGQWPTGTLCDFGNKVIDIANRESKCNLYEELDAALLALTTISDSSKLAKQYVDSDGSPMTLEDEIDVIHSIADDAVERLHDCLDELSVERGE